MLQFKISTDNQFYKANNTFKKIKTKKHNLNYELPMIEGFVSDYLEYFQEPGVTIRPYHVTFLDFGRVVYVERFFNVKTQRALF